MSEFYAPPPLPISREALPPIYPSFSPIDGNLTDTPSSSTLSNSSPRISVAPLDSSARESHHFSTHLPTYFPHPRRDMLPPSYRPARTGSPREEDVKARDMLPGVWHRFGSEGPPSPGAHLLDDVALPLPLRPSMPYPRQRNDSSALSADFQTPSSGLGTGRSIAELQGRRREVASYYDGPGESSRPDWARAPHSNGGGGGGSGGPNGASRMSGGGPSSIGGGDYYSGGVAEPAPASAGYPGSLYDNVPISEGQMPSPTWGMMPMEQDVGGPEFAQALQTYEAILGAIPHVRPAGAHSPPGSSAQPFETLVRLAQDGIDVLSGQRKGASRPLASSTNRAVTVQKRAHDSGPGKEGKPSPKCLGCGATETPEWRRGPMGPRTLCNACGLVHIKLQRKRKKMEEKAAAEAAKRAG